MVTPASRPELERQGCATPRNGRSFTGIRRRTSARTRRTPAFALLAFIYRDVAEMERRFVGAGRVPAAAPGEPHAIAWISSDLPFPGAVVAGGGGGPGARA